jgi:hypothetical protein
VAVFGSDYQSLFENGSWWATRTNFTTNLICMAFVGKSSGKKETAAKSFTTFR